MYCFFHRKHTLFPVRSELNSICSAEYCSLHSGCTMAEAVSIRPLTAETRVRSRVSRCDKVKLGQFFSEHFRFPFSVHSTNAAYSSQSTRCPYQKDELANAGNFPKTVRFRKSGSLGQKSSATFKELDSDTAPRLGVPVCAAPQAMRLPFRSLLRSGPPPHLGLHLPALPIHRPPSVSGDTDHFTYDLVMNRSRDSTPGLTVTVTRNVTLIVTIQRVNTWSCWADRTERLVI